MRIVAFLTPSAVIDQILTHLRTHAPSANRRSARSPPSTASRRPTASPAPRHAPCTLPRAPRLTPRGRSARGAVPHRSGATGDDPWRGRPDDPRRRQTGARLHPGRTGARGTACSAAIGARAATLAMRSFATTMCALRGAKPAHRGARAVVSAGDRSRSAIRVGTHALALVGPRTPSRRPSAVARAMDRVRGRGRTSASRTASAARTCRRASARRDAGREAPVSQASRTVRASRVSIFERRDRVADIGASFGSATIPSWPSVSRWRATHARSVLASSRMRARGRAPNPAGNRSRLAARRRSVIVPSAALLASRLARMCRSRPMRSMTAGLPVCAPSPDGERVNRGGATRATTVPWRPSRRVIPTILIHIELQSSRRTSPTTCRDSISAFRT